MVEGSIAFGESMTIATKSWYLVYTKPRQEEVALRNLARQGYGAYMPRAQQVRRRSGRRIQLVEPLFPRYLFIHLDTHTDNWGPIRSTIGVTTMVRFGQYPAQVPDALVAFLQGRESAAGLHEWAGQKLKEGDRVRVAEGAFQGYEGILLARTSRERVLVLLDILGKQVRTRISDLQLERG
jgi:transcriptional antiterminator RfaH